MRNCFVPGCDAFCRKHDLCSRKMFLPPKALFEEWSRRLPKKRKFKAHDRVCERHFEVDMIVKFWEININGTKHLTPRDKPKLKENAVPSLNLPCQEEDSFDLSDVQLAKQKAKVELLSHIRVEPVKRPLKEKADRSPKKMRNQEKVQELKADETEEQTAVAEVLMEPLEDTQELKAAELEIKTVTNTQREHNLQVPEVIDPEKLAMFETLYDEAFDVTLPSLLWGIHRDPERKFLAFSEFDNSSMSTRKLLHITDSFTCKTFINNTLNSGQSLLLAEATTDGISVILDELDKKSQCSEPSM